MDKLERYLENVERIANSLELLVERKNMKAEEATKEGNVQASQNQICQTATASMAPAVNTVQMPSMPVAQVQMPQVPTAIPVAQQVESFTQEQIARAMANAAQAGRQDVIQNIFATFRVQTLMEINPANYNHVATMLREAGIQI